MKIKAILFDLDGVLYDSMPLHARSWKEAFAEFGIKISERYVHLAEGVPGIKAAKYITSLAKKKLSITQLQEITDKKRDFFQTYKKAPTIKGAKRLVRYLQKQGFKICIVTGTTQTKSLLSIQKDFGIKRQNIIAGNEVRHSKPHPEPYLKALKKLKVTTSQALVIENAPLGIISAKKAKIKCVALTTGPLSKKVLQEAGADWIFKDCGEVLDNLSRILN